MHENVYNLKDIKSSYTFSENLITNLLMETSSGCGFPGPHQGLGSNMGIGGSLNISATL